MAHTDHSEGPSQLYRLRHGFQIEQDYDTYADIVGNIASRPLGGFRERIRTHSQIGHSDLAENWALGKAQYSEHAYAVVRNFAELGFRSRPLKFFALSPDDVQLAFREDLALQPVSTQRGGPEWPTGMLEEIDAFVQGSLATVASYAFSWGRTGSIDQFVDFEPPIREPSVNRLVQF